jgi:hypothetical protein
MRKLSIAIVSGAFALSAAPATAACHKVACVNGRVASLQGQVKTLKQQLGGVVNKLNSALTALNADTNALTSLKSCLRELPVTVYGAPQGTFGYVYNDGTKTFQTTALDATFQGDSVSAWILDDACNPATTAAADGARGVLAPPAPWRGFVRRTQ